MKQNPSIFPFTARILIGAFVLLAFIYHSCSRSGEHNETGVSSSYFLNHHDSVRYVGIQSCAGCHADKVNTFMHTGMGQSFHDATPRKSAARFGEEAHIYDSYLDFHYRAFWRDSMLFICEYRVDSTGDTSHYREQKIDYIIGSGQHTNSHLFREGDYIYQAPMTWYSQKGRWDFPPGFEKGENSRFSRQVDVECISCHNAIPEMIGNSGRAFARVGKGIDCERCHGPGELHVKFRQSGGVTASGKRDSTIVNPAHLSPNLQIDLCQRCHLQGNNVLQEGKTFTDFRPGMELKNYFEVYSPDYKGDNGRFNMADHSKRLQMSRCYQATENTSETVTCITCHNPHVSVKVTGKEVFNNACKSCHSKGDATCTESMSVRLKSDNNCVQCHMPSSGSGDIPHVTVHDHRIGIHDTLALTTSTRLKGLYAVNNEKPQMSAKIKAYLSYYEKFTQDEFYLAEAEKMLAEYPDMDLEIHLQFLRRNWKKIVEVAAENEGGKFDAFTHYRIGKAFGQQNKTVQALVHLRKALEMEPDYKEFYSERGVLELRMEYITEAIITFEAGLKKFPKDASMLSNAGFAHYMAGNMSSAHHYYSRSLSLHPDHLPTLKNMAQWYLSSGDTDKVRYYLNRVLALDPGNREAGYLMKQLDSGAEIR